MTLSVWRNAHLALALLASVVLIIASITGAILALDAASENTQSNRVANFDDITLVQFLPELHKQYAEITTVSVDHNQQILLEAFDEDGNEVKAIINPNTGEQLGNPVPKSEFIQWTTALHRSLFLHETGRFIVGFASFLFFLITVSGTVLIIKRQNGIRHFFAKINKDFIAQYLHVATGRIMLIPMLIISLTATYLFLLRFEIIPQKEAVTTAYEENAALPELKLTDFPIFKETKLSEVHKIEFPFMDDPEEYFILKLKNKELTVHQFTGQILNEVKYPFTAIAEKFSLDLHTGRTSALWAMVLALASVNVLLFIYSGCVITLKRTQTKVKNKYKAEESEYILLVGSENGSTFGFANQIHIQLQANGKKSYLTDLNHYQTFPSAKHLLIFTSTYGLGEAPSNASKFEELVEKHPQNQEIAHSVVGFGSKAYPDFCEFAKRADVVLSEKPWAKQQLKLYTVNDKSAEEFTNWVADWSISAKIALASAPSLYSQKLPKLQTLQLVDRAEVVTEDATTFRLNLKTSLKFNSGDLLAIYPENNAKERFYSIGKVNNTVQLIVRLYPNGLGSGFLHRLQKGEKIKARIIRNNHFHFPKKAYKVALIANGTGIAPFLGMLDENTDKTETHLYCGFRRASQLTQRYTEMTDEYIRCQKLQTFHLALSRQEPSQYVMDLVKRDEALFLDLLENNGIIMICGSLVMQKDVEAVLSTICQANNKDFALYKANGQVLTDCY